MPSPVVCRICRIAATRPSALAGPAAAGVCPFRLDPHLGGVSTPKGRACACGNSGSRLVPRSEEHTSELQSHSDLVCRLLLEKKKKNTNISTGRESHAYTCLG